MAIRPLFTPNAQVSTRSALIIVSVWATAILGYWTVGKPVIFPSPLDVAQALPRLWTQDGLGDELISSFMVNVEALTVSSLLSLPLAYVSRVPAFQPVARTVARLRFLSPATFFLVLLYAMSNGHQVKVSMLALGETFFLVTTMVGVVEHIPLDRFDDAKTLRMSPWIATWYVAVRGTLAEAIDAIRDNAAMGWSMLIMVEGIVRSEGGVGVMMLNQEKHVNFAEVYAIALAIIVVGMAQDYGLSVLRQVCCPYVVTR